MSHERHSSRPAAAASRSDFALLHSRSDVERLASELATESIFAFDTEFVRERTFYPQLGLIQIATRDKVSIVDPVALSKADLAPLLEVLSGGPVLKTGHAIEQDQECLYSTYGVTVRPALDTALGAALVGLGDQIGLGSLLGRLLNVRLPKTHTRTDWLRRPLHEAMMAYAVADVRHLVSAAEQLIERLRSRQRLEWALKLSDELCRPERYVQDPDALSVRLAVGNRLRPREYAILRELVRWRENRVRRSDLPRRWLAEDKLLVQLALAAPATAEELSQFRGLGAKTVRNGAHEILEAIRRGAAEPEDRVPPLPERQEPEGDEGASLSLLKCFLSVLAHEHQVAQRFLVETEAILPLLRGRFQNAEQLRASGLISEGALDLFGEQLIAILQGRWALKLSNGSLLLYRD